MKTSIQLSQDHLLTRILMLNDDFWKIFQIKSSLYSLKVIISSMAIHWFRQKYPYRSLVMIMATMHIQLIHVFKLQRDAHYRFH